MTDSTSPPTPETHLPSRWHWARFPFVLWAFTRVGYILLGFLSLKLSPGLRGSSSASLHPYPAFDALCCWDCGWFDRLARMGYGAPMETNVWPGLPLLSRWVAKLTGMPVGFAILTVTNLACLGSYLVIYRLFARIDGTRAARAALILFAAYPFAFFHASGYPETLMILFSALAISFAMSGRHVMGGLALGVGILARHLSVFLGAGLLAAQLRQRGLRGFFAKPTFLTLALPFLLAGVYMIYCWRAWGDPVAFWHARDEWSKTAWWTTVDAIRNFSKRPHIASYIPFAVIPSIGALLLLRARRYAELAAAALPLMAALWWIGAFGLGRYSASCWPAFLPLGQWYERHPRWQIPILLFFGLAQGWYFFLHSHHYEIQ
jgi:Dolichyl-phosphate-mannose-protein mannosyltransferase